MEGLEPLVLFGSKDDAAKNYGHFYNDNSIRKNQEYGSTIYSVTSGGTKKYGYSIANVGTTGASVSVSSAPTGTTPEGDIHTHAAYDPKYSNNIFSGIPKSGSLTTSTTGDIGDNNSKGMDGYVATPNGSLQKYDVTGGTISTIDTSLPSDSADPARLNTVSSAPSTSLHTIGKGDTLGDLAKRFDTTVSAIVTENKIADPKKISAGTTIKITN